jgi:hypothetical protein
MQEDGIAQELQCKYNLENLWLKLSEAILAANSEKDWNASLAELESRYGVNSTRCPVSGEPYLVDTNYRHWKEDYLATNDVSVLCVTVHPHVMSGKHRRKDFLGYTLMGDISRWPSIPGHLRPLGKTTAPAETKQP